MDGNTEMLNYIYQNTQMGTDTINQLLGIVDDDKFSKQLQSQLNEYKNIKSKAAKMLNEHGRTEKGISTMLKVGTYMNIEFKTMKDNSPEKVAEMLIQGSTMGVIDATKNLKKYKDADSDILKLGEKLLKTEESNIDNLKSYLG